MYEVIKEITAQPHHHLQFLLKLLLKNIFLQLLNNIHDILSGVDTKFLEFLF